MYCLSNGTLPLTYSWKKNKSYIKQQGNILLLHKVDRIDSGLYSCEVFNSVGSQISNAVNLSVSCKFIYTIFIFHRYFKLFEGGSL